MSKTINRPPIPKKLQLFKDKFGEELEICSFSAHMVLEEIIQESDPELVEKKLQDFIWDFADELDACNPEAFDVIYQLAQEYSLEIW